MTPETRTKYEALYNKHGMSAVFEEASRDGITDHEYCKSCECLVPQIDHECLVCGQETAPLKIAIDSESVNIYADHGEDKEPDHIVYWHRDEWVEDPDVVIPIANAIRLFYEDPDELVRLVKSIKPADEWKPYKERCRHCVCLTDKGGANWRNSWYCDELNKPICEVEDCPEELSL